MTDDNYPSSRGIALRSIVIALGMGAALTALVYPRERDRICRPGYAASLRLTYAEYAPIRDAAFARADVPTFLQCVRAHWRDEDDEAFPPQCWILDHIVPLELGGSWDPDNLQLQPYAEAKAKDRLEDYARQQYCGGKLSLEQARAYFTRTRR